LRKIAERSGVSRRRVCDIHQRFKALKILDWKEQKIEGTNQSDANFYTLLLLGNLSRPPCTPSTTPCTPSTTSCTEAKRDNCTVVEQSFEESTLTKRISDASDHAGQAPTAGAVPVHRLSKASEVEIMGRLRTLLGEDEMARAGGEWRNRLRKSPAVIESGLNELDQKVREADKGIARKISNRGAWLTDWYKRMKN
jgi:hypothetical protein